MRKFRTKQARNRERLRLTLVLLGSILVAISIIGLFIYGTHREEVRIQDVYISTDGSLTKNVLETYIRSEMEGSYFGILPKNSIVFIRTQKLENNMKAQYPRILTANIRRAGAQSLRVAVHERSPDALWCGDIVPPVAYEYTYANTKHTEEMWGSCYLMDDSAYIYAKAPMYTGDVFPRYYGSLIEAEPIGQQFISGNEFDIWQNFFQELADEEYALKAILFVDDRDMELYLTGALRLLVSRTQDVEVTKRHIQATLTSGVLDSERVVEYLDLRFGSKAYVKYVNEEEGVPSVVD